MPTDAPTILFTGFEPSGDDHASAVIAEIRARWPRAKMFAWGGRKMEAAGATIVERTGDAAVMGLPGLAKIREHRRINERVDAWLAKNRPTVHVPVDSPAANFPICARAKRHGAKVVHLVAPQIWAWGPWRIKKLRRCTDHVLCLLPFEERYFTSRGVRATFVGHPLFDHPLDLDAIDAQLAGWPSGSGRRIGVFPGSRPSELTRNFPLLLDAYGRLAAEHPGMTGVVAATRPEIETTLRDLASAAGIAWPDSLRFVAGQTDAAARWCELALVVSGTVTLQIARQHRPMVIVYKSSRVMWSLIARWLIRTPHFSLPNLIAGRAVVPELIPHFGGPGPIVDHAIELLESPDAMQRQRDELAAIARPFAGHNAAERAAEIIARHAGLHTGEPRPAPPPPAPLTAERG